MHKGWKVAIACALAVGLLCAPALEAGAKSRKKKAKKVSRPVSYTYSAPSSVGVNGSIITMCVNSQGCLDTAPVGRERYVSFAMEDTSTTDAPFVVTIGGESTIYCGTTDGAIEFARGATIEVDIPAFAVPQCAGVATSGTLKAVFSNLP